MFYGSSAGSILILKAVLVFSSYDDINIKISGGKKVSIDKYPYIVSILTRNEEIAYDVPADNWTLICAGTVIAKWTVLTAATCINKLYKLSKLSMINCQVFNKSGQEAVVTSDVVIRGNTETWKCDCHRARDHTVTKYITHSKFKEHVFLNGPNVHENDIGIINVLEEFVGIFETIIPYQSGSMYWRQVQKSYSAALGWGPDVKDGAPSNILRMTDLVVFDEWRCKKTYRDQMHNMKGIFCATVQPRNIAGPCQLDEGGPLIGLIRYEYKALVGIAANALACDGKVSIFTNVTFFEKWIAKQLNEDSDPNKWYR